MISDPQRRRFDRLFEQIMEELPEWVHDLLEEVPVIVDDEPTAQTLEELECGPHVELCGLHWGVPLTHRSVEHGARLPDVIHVYRGPILRISGAIHGGRGHELERQIRITLLHEIGHHFGLDEVDLDVLGYGSNA